MESVPLESGACVRADAKASVQSASAYPLRPADAELIAEWAASLRSGGYAASSIDRATKRLETFARHLPNGLLRATEGDIVAFYKNREALVGERKSAQRAVGLRPVNMAYWHHPSWANFVATAKQFYAWTERQGFTSRSINPIHRIREYRRASTGVTVQPEWYGQMLHHPSLTHREGSLLWLLAHGLTPAEVLRLTPADVDLQASEVHVRGHHRARTVPLSARAVRRLTPWVVGQYSFGRRWLFPSRRGRPLSDRSLREIVQTVAQRVFPHPSQGDIRREIHPMGFRNTFIFRALRQGVPVDCLISLTGIGRAELLTRYMAQTTPPERVRAEFERIIAAWQDWI